CTHHTLQGHHTSFYAATNCDTLSDMGIKCKSETRPAAAPYRDATACRDVGRCRHLDSPPRHSALEQDTVLPLRCACPACFFPCFSPIHALPTGWHRSCSATAHKTQLLRTTRRKAAYGLLALEALPPQTLPVLYTFRRRRVMAAVNYRTADVDGLQI